MKLTPEELQSKTLSEENLHLAVQLIKANGYVTFESVFPPDFVENLRSAFLQVLEKYVSRTDPNRGANRYQMHMPFMPPFNDPAVITNPITLAIIDEMLGKDAVCHYFASDTALPGSEYQKVHSDIYPVFPEAPIAPPAYSIVMNIPLVDVTEENGPMEIWPGGSHLIQPGVDMQKLAPLMRSERALTPGGSLLLRDMRMWHRGTPNRSAAARPNVALIYSRHWMNIKYPRIGIPRETYEGLSERAKTLFRYEAIGGALANV